MRVKGHCIGQAPRLPQFLLSTALTAGCSHCPWPDHHSLYLIVTFPTVCLQRYVLSPLVFSMVVIVSILLTTRRPYATLLRSSMLHFGSSSYASTLALSWQCASMLSPVPRLGVLTDTHLSLSDCRLNSRDHLRTAFQVDPGCPAVSVSVTTHTSYPGTNSSSDAVHRVDDPGRFPKRTNTIRFAEDGGLSLDMLESAADKHEDKLVIGDGVAPLYHLSGTPASYV
jgi:hypothetical protein